tara:strand:- start:108 stop:1610 length:1503 start_codon:yes stop_codon:yes gene_type:complete
MPHVKRPRSPRRYEKTFGGGAGRHGRGGSSSDSDFKAFKEYARRKGKGLRGGHHDSDSEDSEFPAVAMNLHRAGFSVHHGGGGGGHGINGGGGGGTNPLLGIDTAPELLMLLNAAEELEMTENPHANVFRGVKRKAARDVIGSGGLDPGLNSGNGLNGLNSLAGLNGNGFNPMAALQMQQQQQQQAAAMMAGMPGMGGGAGVNGLKMENILAAQIQLAQQQQQQQQQQMGGFNPNSVEAAIMMARQMQAQQGFTQQGQFAAQQQQQMDAAQWQQLMAAQQAQQQFAAAHASMSSAAAGWGTSAAAASAPAPAYDASAPIAPPAHESVPKTEPVGPPAADPPANGVQPTAAGTNNNNNNNTGDNAELDAFIQQLAARAAELYQQLGPHATVVQTLTTLVVACHRGGYVRDAELAAGQLWEVIRASRFPGGVGETPEGVAALRAQFAGMLDQALGSEGAASLVAGVDAKTSQTGNDDAATLAAAAAAAQTAAYPANTGVGAH